ncbi:MAG: hypothetical protein ACHQRL_04045 [Gemmatimonadales bacterium]|jgi:hypothetical protein
MAAPKEGDLKAGLTGLIIGGALLFGALTLIVHFTHRHYAAEEPPAAEATH